MSFSTLTKNELARVMDPRPCCKMAELVALIKMDGSLQVSRGQVSLNILNHNAAVARKLFKLLKELFGIHAEVLVKKKMRLRKNNVYWVRIPPQDGLREMLIRLGLLNSDGYLQEGLQQDLVSRNCCRRAYLRGAFLGGGSVNSPGGNYHMEIITSKGRHATDLCRLMQKFGLSAKISRRKTWFVIYLKDSEQIVECLNVIGAHSALLEFENTRIYKGMRNQVNRLVNCETANLNKTVDASLRQTESITLVARTVGIDKLPSGLREIAELRLKFPDATLKELGEMANPPLGKSGVNHRLRKLDQMAEKLRAGEPRL
ncbi:Sporulation transcription regulator WhiA [Sporotomaculum syntrophicum]|uniref:Probable cell division protein WhiA n=1 Tax=Sporotomaculum syntrophicum TaxID=182264 RepID=A0A9D2WRQ5_9FIRM|nr:DNA-binding protein WhiA [Sporotomaculum syntrophicum]KAF1086138.1 Sporulation transcription regulator WhiA [Sporotomaculum syntrophicum]